MTLDTLYTAYAKTVYNLALHYTQQTEDAEEITQDVFLRVHEQLDTFRGEATAKTWITRITINRSLDFLRAKGRQKRGGGAIMRTLGDSAHHPALHEFAHPGYALEQREAVGRIYACLNRLAPKQRTAILLLKVEGHSQAETASLMELTVKAVESLFQRGKRGLKACLQRTSSST